VVTYSARNTDPAAEAAAIRERELYYLRLWRLFARLALGRAVVERLERKRDWMVYSEMSRWWNGGSDGNASARAE
jgi:hypothetical protein